MNCFDSFAFDNRLMTQITAAGYTTPTPIQEKSIPLILEGNDVMGLAQTGTGKTAAFALPLLQRLLAKNVSRKGPARILVLAPTRELAVQIHDNFTELGQETGYKSAVIIGGVSANPQVRAAWGASVLVACPGRLLDLLGQKLINLNAVSTLVIDEADRLFDMGFLPDIKKIMASLPKERQTLLFSATMPDEVRELAEAALHNPKVVQIANTAPAETISHTVYPVAMLRKQELLEKLLSETDLENNAALIFTRTKHRAKVLADKLSRRGWRATALQGNLSQNRRQEAMDGFKGGKYQIMVATDIAARGIDCLRISLVVNFDLPDTAEAYTHRIGRTGRAERSGQAVSLVGGLEDEAQIRYIERSLRMALERKVLADFAPVGEEAELLATAATAGAGRPFSPPWGQQRRPVGRGRRIPGSVAGGGGGGRPGAGAGTGKPGSRTSSSGFKNRRKDSEFGPGQNTEKGNHSGKTERSSLSRDDNHDKQAAQGKSGSGRGLPGARTGKSGNRTGGSPARKNNRGTSESSRNAQSQSRSSNQRRDRER